MNKRTLLALGTPLLSIWLFSTWDVPSATAQVLYGSIVGTVVDTSEAALPDVTVTVKDTATNFTRQATTNTLGAYTVATVPAGLYELTVAKPGFGTISKKGIEVSLNSVTRVDLTLQVGAVATSVDVSASAPALQTDRSEVRTDVTSRQLENLPVAPGRNYQYLFKTIPGISPPNNGNSVVADPSRSLIFSANGSSRSSNNMRIDGSGVNSVWLPQNAAYVPTLEAIETVNVVTNSFDAEQGLAGGSATNVLIKSGTNQMHGSAFEFHNDNATKARPFFLPANQGKPKAVFNQFGGTVVGPIRKDKLFYFGSYEGALDHQFGATFATVPTEAMRRGDLSRSPNPIYDPRTGAADGTGRTPFLDKQIPADRFDPVAQKLLGLFPKPTDPNALTNNLYAGGPYSFDRHKADVKVNWNPANKFNIFARLGLVKYNLSTVGLLGDPLGGPPVVSAAGAPGTAFGTSYNGSIGATYIVSPSFILDGSFGYTLMDTNQVPLGVEKNAGRDLLGIPGTNGTRAFEGGFPRFVVDNYTDFGFAGNTTRPIYWHDPRFQYAGNASWTRGQHNLRFGVDISRQHLNQVQPEFVGAFFGASGGFGFNGGITTVKGGPSPNQFNSWGAFLLGQASTLGRTLIVPDNGVTTRATLFSLYARDQWQFNRRLTISYGLRWEYYPVPTRADRGLERYDADTNKMLICGVGSTPADCGVSVSKTNFAPRLGLAYRASDTFVIRAGYGITVDPYSLARPMRTNYPILVVLNVSAPSTFQAAGTLKGGIPLIAGPDISKGIVDIPGNVAANTLPNDFKRGYIQSWNFTLEKEIKGGLAAQIAYIGTRQIRQLGFLELNYGVPGGGAAGQALFQKFGRSATTPLVTSLGNSHYDALQAQLKRRYANGLQVTASYTYSKSMGLCCNENSDGALGIQIPQYLNLNRSVSGFDRTHNFQLSEIYEFPFGKNKRFLSHGLGAAILGGWQFNGLVSAYSGAPFSVSAAGTSLNAPNNTQRADQVKSTVQILGGIGKGSPYFDPFAFAPVTTARFGTAGYNSLRGPGLLNVDAGLFRKFSITERIQVEFRAEGFNFTNTPHFANPGSNVSNLQLNTDGTIRNLGGYSEITGVTGTGRDGIDERVFRFGLRLSF